MLKMGLPMGAAKNALQRDGLDPAILDLDHNAPATIGSKEMKTKNLCAKKPRIRRKRVFWNKVEAKEGTIWSALKDMDVKLTHDIEEFEGLFSQSMDAKKKKTKKEVSESPSKAGKTVKVIK